MIFDSLEDLVLFCAVLSKLAYQDQLDLSTVKDELLHEHMDMFNDPNTVKLFVKERAWFIYDSKIRTAYIAFRGTDSQEDRLLNLHFFTRPLLTANKALRVHAGYLNYYKQIRSDILEYLTVITEEAGGNDYKVILTGHSLGGAAAMICSLDLLQNKLIKSEKLTCITFGTPMVGNAQFCKYYSQNVTQSFHINCGVDIAPRIPIPGLQHVPSTIIIPMPKTSIFDYVNHHSMDTHLRAIRERVPWYKQVTRSFHSHAHKLTVSKKNTMKLPTQCIPSRPHPTPKPYHFNPIMHL